MQHNHDFHLHHQLVDAIKMLGEFESFYFNKNFHNDYWHVKPNFLRAPHLIWCIDVQIPGKAFLVVLKYINGGRRKFLFLYPQCAKNSGPMSSKVDVMKFLQYIKT